MEQITLAPISQVNGTVTVPGSKSLSNRALLLAALAEGETHLTNLLDSHDIQHMLSALTKLGVSYRLSEDKTECWVKGLAGGFAVTETTELYLGNAGTAMRPLCAALALSEGEFVLTGEPRMEERPIGALVDSLRQLGANIEYLKNDGYPPVKIIGQPLNGGQVTVDGSVSSQFLTALLMVCPLLSSNTGIKISGELVSKPYIDITLKTMAQFGIDVSHNNFDSFDVKGNQTYQSVSTFLVEGDASSASYFLAAGAIKGGTVRVNGVGKKSIQGDIRFADALTAMGAKVEWGDTYIEVTSSQLQGIDMDMNHIPDAAMTLATTALFANGKTTLRNIYNWRVKETDRLSAMATELKKLGASVVEGHDYISITPTENLKHVDIDTYNDHRIAMCFSLVALSDTAVTINDPDCTAKTFPDYFKRFTSLYIK